MIATMKKKVFTFQASGNSRSRLAAHSPSWLHEIRRAAMAGFAEKGFPTTRQEEWRNTNVAPIAAVPFQPATTPAPSSARRGVGRPLLPSFPLWLTWDAPSLSLSTGVSSKQLSTLEGLPAGVKAGSLAEALASDAKTLERHWPATPRITGSTRLWH